MERTRVDKASPLLTLDSHVRSGLLLSSLACCSRLGSYLTGESLPRRWGGLSRLVTDPPARVLRVLLEGSTRCVVLDQRPDVHQIDSTR